LGRRPSSRNDWNVARVDYDIQAAQFEAGRAVGLENFAEWREEISRHLPAGAGIILDVGAGTGIWLNAFSEWFENTVIGLEPSRGMRAIATGKRLESKTSLVAASAEAIPIRDDSCSMAWLSTVVHHLSDVALCAAELRRVLRAGAPVLIRNSFPHRHHEVALFRFFDESRRIANAFPTVEDVVDAFARSGFPASELIRVREPAPESLIAVREWVIAMRRADSALAPLSDDQFAQGLRRIDEAIAEGEEPIRLGLDLLVLS
jgi:ubiquinone/menaquinone biosynthesis C-methylase UbiE